MSKRLRFERLALVTFILGGALFLTLVHPRYNALGLEFDSSARAQEAQRRNPYDLSRARIVGLVAERVAALYVEPARIDWDRMLLAGLSAVQVRVAPVIVEHAEGAPTLTLRVGTASRTFRVDDVTSDRRLTARMGEALGFVQEHLGDEAADERPEIEYAAINGMLHTLDPHSALLPPAAYNEMRTGQRGQFGGLGIVISIRDGHLTVIRPIDGTPASAAGIGRGERIVRIGDESTLNMPLSEAVSRLRGEPGEPVDVWFQRRLEGGNWEEARKVRLVRAVIQLQTVESRMLGDHVGYIKINDFQSGETANDVRRALARFHTEDLRGVVLDLRGNPGGFMDQAIEVVDAFVSRGPIVSTRMRSGVRGDRGPEVRSAREAGTEPNYPMVVLINGGSASASEIVAGALKNHGRALIVGQRSFGKGSVQQLFDFPDGSALKLTIAQYLTPGDVSIQGVGIVPDIAIDPMTVDREDMDVEVDQEGTHEADLRSSLTSDAVRAGEQPSVVMRYFLPVEVRRRLLEANPEDNEENELEEEFLTRFGHLLVARARRPGRREMLEDARPTVDQIRDEEMAKTVAELQNLGIDWSVGPDQGASDVLVEASTDATGDTVPAGASLHLRVRVTNRGTATLYQLRAHTESDNGLFDDRELVFGRLAPGETREWSAGLELCQTQDDQRVCRVPRFLPDRADGIRIRFDEAHGHAPAEATVRTRIRALPRPALSYQVQVADDQVGDGDGTMEPGERGSLFFRIRNVGEGPTFRAEANLRNESGRGVLLREGRRPIGVIAPGTEQVVRFGFDVLSDFAGNEVKLTVTVYDPELRENLTHELIVPVHADATPVRRRQGTVRLARGTTLLVAPSASAEVLATVEADSIVTSTAEVNGYVRVLLENEQPAWVIARSARRGSGAVAPHVRFALSEQPPRIALPTMPELVTRGDSVHLTFHVEDDRRVRDAYIFVGSRKVFYQAAAEETSRAMDLVADVPLHAGTNVVTLFVRESPTSVSQRTWVFRRDGADGALLETPRFEDDWFTEE